MEPTGHSTNTCQLRPLQTPGRYRAPEVERQICALLQSATAARFRLAEQSQEEALVYLFRELHRGGKQEAAWQIAELLTRRAAGYIARAANSRHLPQVYREQCMEDIQHQMLIDLMNLKPGCEFWEICFWRCLRFRAINALKKYDRIARSEFQPMPLEDGEGHQTDFLDERYDAGAPSVEETVVEQEWFRAILDQLPDEPRRAILLLAAGLSQEEVAQHLGKTVRTIYNWRRRAAALYEQHRH
jgi:RNA polymerase sigma factor (sigma-70 family)